MAHALLERALAAEEECDALRKRIADLESRMRAALNADPTTASRALSWIGRAEAAEELLRGVMRYVDQRSLMATELPPGWVARAEGQLAAVAILKRDQAEMAERPEGEDYWTTFVDGLGRRGIVKDGSGWMHRD